MNSVDMGSMAAGTSESDEMRPEYDFAAGKKNPYAARFARGSNIVMIRPEIFAAFPSEDAVNDALESLMRAGAAREVK